MDIVKDVEKLFDSSNYELGRWLPKGSNRKDIGLMKDELGGNLMTKFATLRPKMCSYLIDDTDEKIKNVS